MNIIEPYSILFEHLVQLSIEQLEEQRKYWQSQLNKYVDTDKYIEITQWITTLTQAITEKYHKKTQSSLKETEKIWKIFPWIMGAGLLLHFARSRKNK